MKNNKKEYWFYRNWVWLKPISWEGFLFTIVWPMLGAIPANVFLGEIFFKVNPVIKALVVVYTVIMLISYFVIGYSKSVKNPNQGDW